MARLDFFSSFLRRRTETCLAIADVLGACFGYDSVVDNFLPPRENVTGPCVVFGYDSVVDNLQRILGPQTAVLPDIFFSAWMSNADVDFQYLSVLQKYRSHSTLLKKAFYKTMGEAGFAIDPVDEADVDMLISQYSENLPPRAGLSDMMQTLRAGGFTIFCCSDASPDQVKTYFDKAGVDMPIKNIFSCDMCEAAKPDAKVYKMVKKELCHAKVLVFAAAHAWDLAGAKKQGFNTAYYRVDEDESGIFGEPDVVADTLPQLGSAILQRWGQGAWYRARK
ncbi:haloacid dehalogenase [Mycena metata]|uniref:Haloacid dehalogenase n=1 Tax=Mycena metata TaxID=1033252 RepID=A0AAD7NQA2_9AGAR|nr:haloacid dehalogenase [Mycena metata]